mmetsp:Transcript_49375/g.117288  ORF Transcript_49375/g.117288 Transcript_49375/m.117288 type:complete len:155 (-) Transcript_49375:362-826(-)
MGKVPNNKAKRTNNKKGKMAGKRACLGRFLNRHIDQVWKDVRADPEKEALSSTGGVNGPTQDSALPRTTLQPTDEDLPAMGQFYCPPTGKYFINQRALDDHRKGRFYKMRVKQLKGAAPHCQRDADAAVGLGVDNGKPLGRAPKTQTLADPMAV